MIFLSHTKVDKPVVEPVAFELASILGAEQVFYDDWSIQPGDGIIDKMNEGLSAPEFVFFFVSKASLVSPMVKLEWQNALMKATKGQTKLIPVRVDGTAMPPILLQSLYLDMHTNGVAATVHQIVKILQGLSPLEKKYEDFSNITWKLEGDPTLKLSVTVTASHLSEPSTRFAFLMENALDDVWVWISGAPGVNSGPDNVITANGVEYAVKVCAPIISKPITPGFPLIFELTPKNSAVLKLYNVLHETATGKYDAFPRLG